MKVANVRIQNYRSIRDSTLPFSQFACVIGENNAGKSNLLLAIVLFLTGTKLQTEDYYDPSRVVRIEMTFDKVTDDDLRRVQEDHRGRIREIIYDEKLYLIREYDTDGSSRLLCKRLMPIDARFHESTYTEGMKGKSGTELRSYLCEIYPDYQERFAGVSTQKAAKERIETIIAEIPPAEFQLMDDDLPTGIPNSVRVLFPEPVYIPAVKDVNDDIKMKESATLGKLIGIVLKQIQGAAELDEVRNAFNNLNSLLNRIQADDGSFHDNRLRQVKSIEGKILSYVQENFPQVTLELVVPPPELKQIFSNAGILVDDGVKNGIDSKGDGLKRAVTFALIRSYVDIKQLEIEDAGTIRDSSYIFLFEEPELFLHPNAQSILFDALSRLSTVHQVITTTHSPAFLSPNTTNTFVKVVKIHTSTEKPYSHTVVTDLVGDMSAKDAFQIICYENNAAAFFAQRVVLVEGDSDLSYFKHTAKILNGAWDFTRRNIPIIRINGKGNAQKYRDFYERFGLEVHTIVDLDALLSDFDKLTSDDEIIRCRSALFEVLDSLAEASATTNRLSGERVRRMTVEKGSWVARYERLKALTTEISRGNYSVITESTCGEIDSLFSWEAEDNRKRMLFTSTEQSVIDARNDLLVKLREQNVYVLSKGTVEHYYPNGVSGADKPTKAINACQLLHTRNDLESVCPTITVNGTVMLELEAMFQRIFRE